MQAGDKKNYINAKVLMWYALAFIEYKMYLPYFSQMEKAQLSFWSMRNKL